MLFSEFKLPADTPKEVRDLFDGIKQDLDLLTASTRYKTLKKIRDQLRGGADALSSTYHPPIHGLNDDQQKIVEAVRTHVNWVRPAVDRLVNSIHAGVIRRRVASKGYKPIQDAIGGKAHRRAMRALCESAFAYGTGYLVPIYSGESGRFTYWHPSPRYSVLAVDSLDIMRTVGLVEIVPGLNLMQPTGVRFVTENYLGRYNIQQNKLEIERTDWGFLPLAIAYGQDQRHEGEKYGLSLVEPAADGSVEATANKTNLKLLRDRQTQSLLVIQGEPTRTSAEAGEGGQGGEGSQKFIQFDDKDKGDAKFISPDPRLDQVIKVRDAMAADAAVCTGLPVDTFLPEKVTGSDASATAARQRAFPLQQRMVDLVDSAAEVEERAILIMVGLFTHARLGGETPVDLDALGGRVKIEVFIQPSLPDSESETLASWQQKTEKFFIPVEEAIAFYGGHLSDETRAALAAMWRRKFEPGMTTDEIETLKFQREALIEMLGDGTVSDMLANLTRLGDLVESVGLPRQPEYEEPFVPVETTSGQLVSGETLKDSAGDVVGGAVVESSDGSTKGTKGHEGEGAPEGAPTNFGQRDAGELDPNNGAGRSGEVTK